MAAQVGNGARPLRKKRQSEIVAHLNNVILSFVVDPADSDYQRGYQAAIEDVKKWINT